MMNTVISLFHFSMKVIMMDIMDIAHQCQDILKENGVDSWCDIDEIIARKNADGTVGYRVIATDREDDSNVYAVRIDIPEHMQVQEIAEWEYTIDGWLFKELEKGYDLIYMPLSSHYGTWCYIDDVRNNIEFKKGLNKYLHFCKTHNISKDTIILEDYAVKDVPDVMDLYVEIVNDYKIVNEISFDDKTVILGYNKDASLKYATWMTSPDRKNGYSLANYYPDAYSALSGFKSRSHKILDDYLYKMHNNELSLHMKVEHER